MDIKKLIIEEIKELDEQLQSCLRPERTETSHEKQYDYLDILVSRKIGLKNILEKIN